MDDLAATLRPLPAEMARNTEAINRLVEEMRSMRTDLSAQRTDLSALQRQIAQIGWGLSAALVGTLVALIVAIV
jgi:ABC-type transporter Mla subunit MlaD